MLDLLSPWFDGSGFMPHGHCYLWTAPLLWLYVASDLVIGTAYYSIPIALTYFVRKRRDLQFNWMLLMFSLFIFACGTTHLTAIWTIWHPAYWLDAVIKAITAVASIITAILLWPLIPRALRVASPEQLQSVITQLEHEVGERKRAEAKLAQLNEQLEVRVAERTGELQAANAQLAAEIEARTAADERMRSALKEKTTLLNEVHHRVKNNLQIVQSLVDLQATQVRDPVVRAMLEDTKNRIHSMALIHQTLYESKNFARIDASSVLNTLVSRIVASYNIEAVQLNVNLNVAAIELPLSVAIPCGLIVNELVTNALKHAFAGRDSGAIDVALIDRAGRITLSVSDNGGGLVQPLDIGNVQTLGLELVTLLADQLGGELSISPAGPTCFSIEFPLAQE